MIKDYRSDTGPSPELRAIEETHTPVCNAPIPGTQNMCTRDAGHDGDHRCSCVDVDARSGYGRDYHGSGAETEIRSLIEQRDELVWALTRLRVDISLRVKTLRTASGVPYEQIIEAALAKVPT